MIAQRLSLLLVAAIVAGFLTAITQGCASTPPATPQEAINEARSTLIAVVRMNSQYLAEDIITVEEHDKRLAQVEKMAKDLEEAETLLGLGKGGEAMDRAQIVRNLALSLRAELERKVKR